MEPASFFAASRLVIVAGKGGVGKTVVSAALARAAAAHGVRTLLVEASGSAAVHRHFGGEPLSYAPRTLVHAAVGGAPEQATVRGVAITPDEALVDYLEARGMRRVARRLARSGTLEVIATATPGIKEILVMGKVKQLVANADVDLVVVDAPAAGHAVGLLRAAPALADTARSGPIQHQASQVLSLLRDPDRCQVVLVTIPEETPVNEVIDTAYALEDEIGVRLGPVVVNGVYEEVPGLEDAAASLVARPATDRQPLRDSALDWAPDTALGTALSAAAQLRLGRRAMQVHHIERLRRELPLEQLELPFLFRGDDGPGASKTLADHVVDSIRALPRHAPGHV